MREKSRVGRHLSFGLPLTWLVHVSLPQDSGRKLSRAAACDERRRVWGQFVFLRVLSIKLGSADASCLCLRCTLSSGIVKERWETSNQLKAKHNFVDLWFASVCSFCPQLGDACSCCFQPPLYFLERFPQLRDGGATDAIKLSPVDTAYISLTVNLHSSLLKGFRGRGFWLALQSVDLAL